MYARRQQSSGSKKPQIRKNINESQKITDMKTVINETVTYMDKWMDANLEKVVSTGSTCVASIIDTENRKMYLINLGDSRAVLIEDGEFKFATTDHKPSTTSEFKRIKEIGGNVQNNRVQGLLAVSRAFGDYYLKDHTYVSKTECHLKFNPSQLQLVSSEPDVFVIDLATCDPTKMYHLCMACDGFWDVCGNSQFSGLLESLLESDRGDDLEFVTEHLVAWAYENNSTDNISLMLIEL